jgi:hypothetical protein
VFLVVAVQFAEFELRLFGLQAGRIDTGFEVDGKAGVRFDDLGTGVIPGRVCRRLDELGGSVSQIAQQTHGDSVRAARAASTSWAVNTFSKAR